MTNQHPAPATPLRARMIADMSARNLGPASQTSHLRACKRFSSWLGRSPETASPDDVKLFQLHLIESRTSICTRNQTMTGVKFLFRVTLRRHDLAAEVFHLKKPVKVPVVLNRDEVRRILAMAPCLKARVMLSLAYGCGLRAAPAENRAPSRGRTCQIRQSPAEGPRPDKHCPGLYPPWRRKRHRTEQRNQTSGGLFTATLPQRSSPSSSPRSRCNPAAISFARSEIFTC